MYAFAPPDFSPKGLLVVHPGHRGRRPGAEVVARGRGQRTVFMVAVLLDPARVRFPGIDFDAYRGRG